MIIIALMTETLELPRLKTASSAPAGGSLLTQHDAFTPSGSNLSNNKPFMNHSRHEAAHRWVFLAIFGDSLMALLGSLLAFWMRFNTLQGIGHFTELELRQYFSYQALGSISLVAVLAWNGIYRSSMLLQSGKVTRTIITSVMLWTAGFLLFALAFEFSQPISRIYMALNGGISLVLLLAWRMYFDARLRHPSRMAVLQQSTILVGWSDDMAELARQFNNSPEHAFMIVGWVETSDNLLEPRPKTNLPCLGHVDHLDQILTSSTADMVILTDLSGPRERSIAIANLCEREMVQFKIIPSCFRVFVSGLQLENVSGTPLLGVSQLPLDSSFNVLMKRCLDVVGAVVGLILFTPVIAIFGAMVWIESRGPIFYRQRRTGANGKPFEIIKIRSMRLNAETNGAQWCTANDPRRLAVGTFMRKWNIDELPQFWNVLTGEMSLVGPRPERPELIANFKYQIPHYNARHHAKPGMTGWAAIKGLRGDTDLTERVIADLWYLENWSLLLDIQIMLMTFSRSENAY